MKNVIPANTPKNTWYLTRNKHEVFVRSPAFSTEHNSRVLFGKTIDNQILYWDLDGNSLDSSEYDLMEIRPPRYYGDSPMEEI